MYFLKFKGLLPFPLLLGPGASWSQADLEPIPCGGQLAPHILPWRQLGEARGGVAVPLAPSGGVGQMPDPKGVQTPVGWTLPAYRRQGRGVR